MNEQETVADIITGMRGGPIPKHRHDREVLWHYADRLDAAWKREKAAMEADALAVGGLVEASRAAAENSSAVGDAAKLREALIKAATMLAVCEWPDGTDMEGVKKLRRDIDAALDAPPRNCDVGTADEQAERYGRYCDKFTQDGMHCETCPCCGKIKFGRCEFAWAQMPYEKGGANE